MITPPGVHNIDGPSRVEHRTHHALAYGALATLLAFWLLWAPLTSASTAAPAKRQCLLGGPADSANALAIARASDNEEAENEEEQEEAEEEAASAEAEAEEEGTGEAGSPSSHGSGPQSHSGSRSNAPIVSRLTLTARAIAALKHSKPLASAVQFSFMLSAPAKVHVTLVKQTSSHGHMRWKMLPNSLTTSAGKGQDCRNLTGHNRLSPGRYRLTVKPTTGRSRSIYLSALH